jgi:hypothetical protein
VRITPEIADDLFRAAEGGLGILKSVFRSPPRLATSRPDLIMVRRGADLKTLFNMFLRTY